MSITPEFLFIIVLILAPFILFLLWFVFGKDSPVIETVEFRPPKDMTPAEVGLLWSGRIHDRDISAMFLHWANQGIISIEVFGEGDLIIRRGKPLPGNVKRFEEKLYGQLFIMADTILASVLAVEIRNIKNYAKNDLLKEYGSESIRSLFDLNSMYMRNAAFVIAFLPFIFYSIYLYSIKGAAIFEGALTIYNMGSLGILLVIIIIQMLLVAKDHVLDLLAGKPAIKLTMTKTIILSPLVIITVIIFGTIATPFLEAPLYAVLTAVSTFLCVFLALIMPRRTFFYTRVLGKIRGYANFIRAAELDRIKMLIDEDPNYVNDMLPYIWAMGMLNEWSELLDLYSLTSAPPQWYEDRRENAKYSYQNMTESLKRSFRYSEKENN